MQKKETKELILYIKGKYGIRRVDRKGQISTMKNITKLMCTTLQ